MDREALLGPIIDALRKGTSVSKPQLLKELADWEVVPAEANGQHVATAILKGPEIHFAVGPCWNPRLCQRGALQEFLRPLFDRHGFLTTRIEFSRTAQKAFIRRLGFEKTWSDENFEYYMLGSVPFERKSQ